jgi:thymidylate synthase
MLKSLIKSHYAESHEEYQYLNLIKDILEHGSEETGRNGKVKQIFGHASIWSLSDNKIPLLTTKKLAWKTCLKELLWFIKGETDNRILKNQGVHIWDANGSREFLDSRGLTHYVEDELGPIYGWQWRNFNGNYICHNMESMAEKEHNKNQGIDQLQEIINILKSSDPVKKSSRRLIMTAWNPCQLDQMALPPCHIMCQFNVSDTNKLSLTMYQRSADVLLGMPFNIASYSFLLHLIAFHCDLIADEFIYYVGNAHIYEQHLEPIQIQIKREPKEWPTIKIKNKHENINDYTINDFEIIDYQSHDAIKAEMIA